MGLAQNHFSSGELESMARAMLTDCRPGFKANYGIHAPCPAHRETEPSFYYNPETDSGYCFGCAWSGDIIAMFNVLHGRDEQDSEGFREFFERFAPNALTGGGKRQQAVRGPRSWEPRSAGPRPELWMQKAGEFVAKRAADLQADSAALDMLAEWGITAETAALCRIGWVPENRFYKFTAWGLPYAENEKGRERCLYAPQGFVFPCYQRGELVRIKIRAHAPAEGEERYRALQGGGNGYGVWGDPAWRVWVIVETERDAMLLWQELKNYQIGAMATGAATNVPDAYAHRVLASADCIVNALDNDAAGARRSWSFVYDESAFRWSGTYPHCLRWLVPSCVGKDVGDLVRAGVDVWSWLQAGLPPHILQACEAAAQRIPTAKTHTGQKAPSVPDVLPFPEPARIAASMGDDARYAYTDAYDTAQKHSLMLRRSNGRYHVVYAAGAQPYKDADKYVQSLLDDNALHDRLEGVV